MTSRTLKPRAPRKLGRFTTRRLLGRGTFGIVWEVEDPLRPGQRLALKLLSRPARAASEDRSGALDAAHEFRLASQARHPVVLEFVEGGFLEQRRAAARPRPYLLSELARGSPLLPRWEPRALVPVAKDLLSALDAIHAAGWRHGDIQPRNILVWKDGLARRNRGRPEVRLLDFGLAEECGRGGIERRTAGTPRYLAPEVLRGARPDRRTDFYALGLILYDCLRGRPEEKLADHLLRTRQGLVFEEVCQAKLPDVWSRILRRLLDPDPDARVESGAEGIALLQEDDGPQGDAAGAVVVPSTPAFEAARPVGNRDVLDALSNALERGSRPRPWLVVVEGGRGQGKTRVVREATARAFVAGTRTLGWDALRLMAREVETEARPGGDEETWLRRALFAASREGEEAEVAERVAALIVELACERPTMVVVDGLERLPRGDRAAARLVVEKIRNLRARSRLPSGRSAPLVLLTVSPGVLRSAEFASWWDRLGALPWTAFFPLEPWTGEDVAEYLDRALPPRRRLGELEAALRLESNPARLRRRLQDLAVRGELRLQKGSWVCARSPRRGLPPIPGDLEIFRREWPLADDRARDLLGVASVSVTADTGVPLRVIGAALRTPLSELGERLRRAAALEVLAPRVVGVTVDGRAVVLSRAQRLWISRAGGREGRARWRALLKDSAAPVAERVAQELRAGPVALSRVLAGSEERGAVAESLLRRHANDARHVAADRSVTARRLGERLHERGELDRADRYLRLARTIEVDEDARSGIDLLLGEIAMFRGRMEEAADIFRRLLESRPHGDPARPRLLGDAASCRLRGGDPAGALDAAVAALREYPGEITLQNVVGVFAIACGRLDQAESVLRSALEQVAGQASGALRAMLCTNCGLVLRRRGRLDEATRLHQQAAAEFERVGLRSLAARAYANLGVGLRRLGDYEKAVDAATKSLELHREAGDEQSASVAEGNLGILARELGLPGTASRRFEAAAAAAGRATSLGTRAQDHPAVLENRLLLALELDDGPEIERLLARREETPPAGDEPLAETLLLELRLLRSGRRDGPERLVELMAGRDFREGDAAFLAELAVPGSPAPDREAGGERGGLERAARDARRTLERLASSSARALFYRRLVELEAPRSEAERERATRHLESAVLRFPVREARLRALRALVLRAPERATREKARSRLRCLLDEILFDLEPGRREAYRRRRDIEEVLEMTRAAESTGPELERARQVVQDVLRFNGEILRETQLEGLVRKIVDAAMALTDAERGVLVMREHGRLRILAARSRGEDLADPEGQISHTLLERALEEGVARLTTDAREDLTLRSVASVEELGLRSVLCVPLRMKRSRVLGALYLDNPFERAVFDSGDLALAETFCSQAALAWAAAERRRQSATLLRQLRRANRDLRAELCVSRRDLARRSRRSRKRLDGLVGDGPGMREVFHLIEVVAPTEIPVLITGESGTGKELVARAIHRLSRRSDRAFVAENCGAVPASLLESALFGHVKGAFTGADRDCPGIFQLADGGTLFLDEIAEMPIELQSRLLRVLQEGEVRPLGARHTIGVDVRVVAATNRDVRRSMEQGRFREDLYYRLQGAEIHVPALRDNVEDVPLLVDHFLETLAGDGGVKKVSVETMDRLARYSWPGNVRQLENEIRRLVVLCPGGVIGPEYLSAPIREAPPAAGSEPPEGEPRSLREVERRAILAAMERLGGNRVRVARALGISRSTLYLKLREIGYREP